MTITISTDHANELILIDDVLDPGGSAVVALGLINQDGSNTFPGRTLTPDQAEELAASLAQAAAATRATAGPGRDAARRRAGPRRHAAGDQGGGPAERHGPRRCRPPGRAS